MSRFFAGKYAALTPYTPGEQPQDNQYIKLNTNESPFSPHPAVMEALQGARDLRLYSDPECVELRKAAEEVFHVPPQQLLFGNGSDELLFLAFAAFGSPENPPAFADLTYGFYPVFSDVNLMPHRIIPLREDMTIDLQDYMDIDNPVFIANPNAPTGIALTRAQIRKLLAANRDRVVVIDEAYVDFGAESCLPLIDEFDNLLVIQTFSKSRSMAGARLGFAAGNEALIRDLNTLKYSLNPYNINSLTAAAGIATLQQDAYYQDKCRIIRENRAYTSEKLRELGFEFPDSQSNFLFIRHPKLDGEVLYRELKARNILVRHFSREDLRPYNRITIGTLAQMQAFLKEIKNILEEQL